MYCKKCGRELSENAKFCAGCGGKVEVESVNKVKTNKISKLKFKILAGVICVVLIGIIGCVLLTGAEKVNVVGEYQNGLIMLQCGDKYGLMDYDGNIVEPCIYKEIRRMDSIPQGKLGDEWVQLKAAKDRDDVKYMYESIGRTKSESDEQKIPIGEDRYIICQADYMITEIVDSEGNVVADMSVETNELKGVCFYHFVEINDGEISVGELGEVSGVEYLLNVSLNGRYGLMDTDGNVLIWTNDYILTSFSEGLAKISQIDEEGQRKNGYINTQGDIVIPFEYDLASDFSEGLAAVAKKDGNGNYKYGFINTLGELVIPHEYDSTDDFSEGLTVVGKKDINGSYKYGYIDTVGEIVIPIEYDDASSFSEGLAAVAISDIYGLRKYGYIDNIGETVIDFKYSAAYDFIDGCVRVENIQSNGDYKWGYVNSSGEEIVPIEYDSAGDFSEGFARVTKINVEGEWLSGYINTQGNIAIPLKYKSPMGFYKGLAQIVQVDNDGNWKYGFIDKTGKEVIEPIYSVATYFLDGIRLEKDGYTYYCINPTMNIDEDTVDIGEFRLAEIDADGNYIDIFNSKKELIVEINSDFMDCAKYYKEAVNSYEKGKIKKAINMLEKAVVLQPDNEYLKDLQMSLQEINYEKNNDNQDSKVFEKNLPSLWFDWFEVKILEYVDKDSMIVKFSLGNYMFQMKVPRILEEEPYYICDCDVSSSSAYISLINENGDRGVTLTYSEGENIVEKYEKWISGLDLQKIYQAETVGGMRAIITYEEEWINHNLLGGYFIGACDEEKNVAMLCGMLSENDEENEITKEYLTELAYKLKEDSDYVYLKEDVTDEYLQRMSNMYEKYSAIIEDTTGCLQNEYMMVGEEYTKYYLVDLTEDSIPEIVFMGRPNWIAIVGEKNAVALNGSSIIWTNVPGEFYTCLAFSFTEEWGRYKVSVDKDGIMSVECIQSEFLSSNGQEYWYEGKAITKEEYKAIFSELNHPYVYKSNSIRSSNRLTEESFRRKVQRLSNDFVYVP